MRRPRSWAAALILTLIAMMAVASVAAIVWLSMGGSPVKPTGRRPQVQQAVTATPASTASQRRPPGPGKVPDVDQDGKGQANSKEIVEGVLPLDAYGVQTWEMLETRVVLNLVHELLDLARARVAQVTRATAGAGGGAARDLERALQPPVVQPNGAGPGPPPAEMNDVGRLSAASLAYYTLHPLPRKGVMPPEDEPGDPRTAILRLLQARQLRSSDAAASARAARAAAEQLGKILAARLSLASVRPTDNSIVSEEAFLGGDPRRRSFPWGWFSLDFALSSLRAYHEEAANLSGDAAAIQQASVMKGRLARQLKLRRKPGNWELPRWTNERRLGRPPT